MKGRGSDHEEEDQEVDDDDESNEIVDLEV